MLSGQGSQYYQMCRDLFQSNHDFRQHMMLLDEIVKDLLGISVVDAIYTPNKKVSDPFDDTTISGLSIFILELALAKTLKEKDIEAELLLGSSFGTFVSLVLAQCLSEEEGIRILAKHGNIFRKTCSLGSKFVSRARK